MRRNKIACQADAVMAWSYLSLMSHLVGRMAATRKYEDEKGDPPLVSQKSPVRMLLGFMRATQSGLDALMSVPIFERKP